MEELSHLGGDFLSSTTTTAATATSAPPRPNAAVYGRNCYPTSATLPYLQPGAGSSRQASQVRAVERRGGQGEMCPSDAEDVRAKIVSHPRYSSLIGAYIDCQKRLHKVHHKMKPADEICEGVTSSEEDPDASGGGDIDLPLIDPHGEDKELKHHLLKKYGGYLGSLRQELSKKKKKGKLPKEARQKLLNWWELHCKWPYPSRLHKVHHKMKPADEICEGVTSSEEDPDASGGGDIDLPLIDPHGEDKELKHHLLKKYGGYLGSLRQELSKKKKKGKLPKEARQKLLNWWELHCKWPYPSETEKVALAESTGLDPKQINNWFINQRKRHWKPSEDMQFVVMDSFHPQNAAALYMEGQFMVDGLYRTGP
ncbi:hypothetical protein C4D60_Mb04t35270 [Musa balbisiana]|uniref:Homeobox domain-containing protein n=1 Tax=Musa balbisiana TaxID=52838 RepID=A0A4S8KH15_MUSBA|nr:hypothetical protein C4D60_Mb04t35270 [Musa balbisiana]